MGTTVSTVPMRIRDVVPSDRVQTDPGSGLVALSPRGLIFLPVLIGGVGVQVAGGSFSWISLVTTIVLGRLAAFVIMSAFLRRVLRAAGTGRKGVVVMLVRNSRHWASSSSEKAARGDAILVASKNGVQLVDEVTRTQHEVDLDDDWVVGVSAGGRLRSVTYRSEKKPARLTEWTAQLWKWSS